LESTAKLTVRRVPLDALVPDPSNPRVHDERNLEAIKTSLARFGQAEIVELEVDDLTATSLGTDACDATAPSSCREES
jgi:hypothetical protein